MTRPLLHDYYRSSASTGCGSRSTSRASSMSGVPVNLLEGEQKSAEYRALNPQGLVPMLEIDGAPADAEPGDHRLSRPALSGAAAAAGDPADGAHVLRDGAGDRLRHPSAQQSAGAQISDRASCGMRRTRATTGTAHWIREGSTALEAHRRAARRPRSCSATRRRWPTSAWCRRCTMRGASMCRSTPIRRWFAPMPNAAALDAFAAAHPDRPAEKAKHEPGRRHQSRAWPRCSRSTSVEIPSLEGKVSAEEWAIRVDLAAAYRLVAYYGWDDLIFTHLSARDARARAPFPAQSRTI